MEPAPVLDGDPDLPGFDPERAQALLAALEAAVAEGVRPDAPDALDPVHRARELQRLLALRGGALPAATVAAVWRELEAARLHRAGVLRIAVWGGARPELAAALARRRFGAAPRLVATRTPEQAVEAAHAPGVVSVLALEGPWWGRLLARPQVRVFAAAWPELAPGAPLALAVAAVPTDATGDDRTFWITDAAGPPERVEARLGEAGFAADLAAEAGGLMLWSLAGYVQPSDPRLARAPGRLTGVIGAAPGPIR